MRVVLSPINVAADWIRMLPVIDLIGQPLSEAMAPRLVIKNSFSACPLSP